MNGLGFNGLGTGRLAADWIRADWGATDRLAINRLAIDRLPIERLAIERPAGPPLATNLTDAKRPVGAMPGMAGPWSILEPGVRGWKPNVAAWGRETSHNRYR